MKKSYSFFYIFNFFINLLLAYFFIGGIYAFIEGLVPITFETSIQNNEVIGTISRNLNILHLKKTTKTINNLDKAFITTQPQQNGRGRSIIKKYVIYFRTINGEIIPFNYISNPYSYSSDSVLVDKINKSIKARRKFKITLRQSRLMFEGCLFMFISCLFYGIKKSKSKLNNENKKNDTSKTMKDGYQKVNDSIIK